MRNINLDKWKSISPDGKEIEESLIDILKIMISIKKPEEMPRGIDNFRLMSRLSKVLEKAEETNIISLEEFDYKFLKESIFKDIPSIWGMNPGIAKAVETFMEAKEE